MQKKVVSGSSSGGITQSGDIPLGIEEALERGLVKRVGQTIFVPGSVLVDPRDGNTYRTVEIGGAIARENLPPFLKEYGGRIRRLFVNYDSSDKLLIFQDNAEKLIAELRDSLSVDSKLFDVLQHFAKRQTWMLDNLRHEREGAYLYPGAGIQTEGLLYSRDAAMKSVPKGWHIPSGNEWALMMHQIDQSMFPSLDLSTYYDTDCGLLLLQHFAPVLAGYRSITGSFDTRGVSTTFWSTNLEFVLPRIDRSQALTIGLRAGSARVFKGLSSEDFAFSVRCVKDIVVEN